MITVTTSKVTGLPANTDITVVGVVSGIHTETSGAGRTRAYASLTDGSGTADLFLTPVTYAAFGEKLVDGDRVEVAGFVDPTDTGPQIYVMRVRALQ